jgi:hypothetical protein
VTNTTVGGTGLVVGANVALNGALNAFGGNSNFDSGVLFVDATNNRIGINNTTPDAALTVTGSANVSGTLKVFGDLAVTGNITSSGVGAGDFIPSTNAYSLGNTTNRWNMSGNNVNLTGRNRCITKCCH